ncbi:unnamed protein product [Brassicogethes aeneus]|uniref:Phosphorylated adapter RNA export protein n=1 Tax=Brassicogethes aeneus TaxID=1431903 RepID=A0A9P0AZ04_BRAAE|nr:unnamed protein product [Brassicogethes aeneus]
MQELEDGEISTDSDNAYTPLERPANYSQIQLANRFPVILPDTDSEEEFSDSDSDSDVPSKKVKIRKPKLKIKPVQRHLTKKKYDIWSSRIKDDNLSETLNNCDVSVKDKSRSVENYDYKLALRMREEREDQILENRKNNKRTRDDRSNVFLRQIQRSKSREKVSGTPRKILDLTVKVTDSPEDIAKDIANKLLEEKEELILKVVNTMGKEKAFEFFNETKKMELKGGMLTMNETRRRTPGGVFLYFVRNDYHITLDQKMAIFGDDRQAFRKEQKQKKKEKHNKLRLEIAASRNKIIPDLLTRAELLASQANRDRRETEHLEDLINPVNPPPTPETDGHENSGDGLDSGKTEVISVEESRQVVEAYDDDFLDIGLSNDMDLF